MEQCVNNVVAFGLNGLEFCTVIGVALVALAVVLIRYLNHGIGETKEERWARKNPFLAVDLDMPPRGKKRDVW